MRHIASTGAKEQRMERIIEVAAETHPGELILHSFSNRRHGNFVVSYEDYGLRVQVLRPGGLEGHFYPWHTVRKIRDDAPCGEKEENAEPRTASTLNGLSCKTTETSADGRQWETLPTPSTS